MKVSCFEGEIFREYELDPARANISYDLLSEVCQLCIYQSKHRGKVLDYILQSLTSVLKCDAGVVTHLGKQVSIYHLSSLRHDPNMIEHLDIKEAFPLHKESNVVFAVDTDKQVKGSWPRMIVSYPIIASKQSNAGAGIEVIGRLTFYNNLPLAHSIVSIAMPLLPIMSALLLQGKLDEPADLFDIRQEKFIATVSHEIRTPVSAIIGLSSLLAEVGPLSNKQQEYVKLLINNSVQLLNLLNNFLDLNKMSAQRLTLSQEPFSIKKVVEQACSIAESKLVGKSVKLEVNISDTVPDRLMGDESRVTQVLVNLLNNAVKFTEKGYIRVKVTSQPLFDITVPTVIRPHRLSFEVRDSGIGIPLSEQPGLFAVFHQGSSSRHPLLQSSGTGLGLAICRELVKLMNGEISVESDGIEGHGSTFSFSINLDEEISISVLKEKYASILSKARVLVVDDRLEYRMQLTEILLRWGAQPTAVASGDEAILYCRNGFNFDVALIDIVMAGISGIELVQEFLKTGYTSKDKKPRMWTIGISSVGHTQGAEFFDYFLCKPIHQSQLFPVLLTCLINNHSQVIELDVESPSASLTHRLIHSPKRQRRFRRDIKILIVEDDKSNSYTLKEMLVALGFKETNITIIEDGNECVKHVKEEAISKRFYDVAFIDILLPGLNGFQIGDALFRMIELKEKEPFLIAISASVQNSDKVKCSQSHFATYITKPAMKDTLLAALCPVSVD